MSSSDSQQQIDSFRKQILEAAQSKTPLSIEGGGSKAWYGNSNHFTKLSTKNFSGILDYQPEELVITARAGTPLREIEQALSDKNQMLAFEPPHFGDNATLGGAIAAGLAGPARISVGNLRDFVLGARIMDGKGQDLSFGGKVMKNVAGYDVSRLMPGSLGTLALILEASVKVLPKPAASTSIRCQITQAAALQSLNQSAGQPLPLSASCWIGKNQVDSLGELTIRLAGAEAAVYAAKILLCSTLNAKEFDSQEAEIFWAQLREQQLSAFVNLQADETLYRLALPAACGPLDLGKVGNLSSEIVLEWHGQERWIKGQSDDATFAALKKLASNHGGHATRFRQGSQVNPDNQRFTLLSEQTYSQALEPIQARLRASFDPSGVFATSRLP